MDSFTMQLLQQSLHETVQIPSVKRTASWNSVWASCSLFSFLIFFFLHTGNSTLNPETCQSIQPAAFLETTSEVYFVRMWVAANTPIWQGFNWGIGHGYIFNNERANCTQAMIFMLTEIL